jgi:hypothetical protein
MESSASERKHIRVNCVFCGANAMLPTCPPKNVSFFWVPPVAGTVGQNILGRLDGAADPEEVETVLQRSHSVGHGNTLVDPSAAMPKKQFTWFRVSETPDVISRPRRAP